MRLWRGATFRELERERDWTPFLPRVMEMQMKGSPQGEREARNKAGTP